MLQILKDTDQRLVMKLGEPKARWTKLVLDKDAGFAWFEQDRRLLPPRTVTVPLHAITAIQMRTSGSRKLASQLLVMTGGPKPRYRLSGETGQIHSAAIRLRAFVGLKQDEPAPMKRRGLPQAFALRAGQAAFVVAAVAATVWLLAPFGGVVADAGAKASGLVARSAERIQGSFLLPACDAAENRAAILELVRDRLGSTALLDDPVQRGQSGDERLCGAVARRGVQTASVSYRSYWDGWTPKVRLTGEIVTLKLDASRTAAIGEAMQTFLAAGSNSHRTGSVPRQSDAAIDKALGVIFGASDLAAEPLAAAEIDKALAWLKDADRVAAVYLLAGTGFEDFAKVAQTAAIQQRMRGNVVAFADEFGRYADFQMVLLAAIANAHMRAATVAGNHNAGETKASADEIRAQLAQAMKSNLIALVYQGHNDAWRTARLTAIGRAAPVAAKFLPKEESRAVHDLALQTVDYFRDIRVRAKVRDIAAALSAP